MKVLVPVKPSTASSDTLYDSKKGSHGPWHNSEILAAREHAELQKHVGIGQGCIYTKRF